MFNKGEDRKEPNVLEELDKEIFRCLENMKTTCNDTPEYAAMAENLKTLYKARDHYKDYSKDGPMMNNRKMELLKILLSCGTGLLQVVMMMLFEASGHVFTTRALGMLFKPKVF